MSETSIGTFQRDVIDASRHRPVVVDFWAPWCGPCRILGPLLEKLERDYAGRFSLVKIDSDRNPELAAQFNVRSIPFVVGFVDGQAVDSFVGVLPEPSLRAFLDALAPDPAEAERRKALGLIGTGDFDAAAIALRSSIALAPSRAEARLDLAELLLERMPAPVTRARRDEAREVLAAPDVSGRADARSAAVLSRLASLDRAEALPGREQLAAKIHADPADLPARMDLAHAHLASNEFEPAFEQLLEVVRRDRGFGNDAGRRTMLEAFERARALPELVGRWRRRLAAELNR